MKIKKNWIPLNQPPNACTVDWINFTWRSRSDVGHLLTDSVRLEDDEGDENGEDYEGEEDKEKSTWMR